MLTGTNIICVSSIDWDFVWQGHQEIMSTLVEQGNRVLFIENTGVRAPGLQDLNRLTHRFLNWWRSTKGFRQERENLFVYSPVILPFPYSRLVRWINLKLLLRALQRWMRAAQFYRPIVWTFLPTPLILDLVHALEPELTVYYCTDDLASSSLSARRIVRSEKQLFREADLVFVTSTKLRERAAEVTNRAHLFPCGVDFEKFMRVRNAPDGAPADLAALPRPIVGYVGGVHQWVDQELLATVAGSMPEASFVLVGPRQTDVPRLARLPNVHLIGARSSEDIPQYIKGFDVGIIPYCLSDYTASVYPTKLNEYLAMGIPVVATDLPEVLRFNAEHGDVVAVAQTAERFSSAIRGILESDTPEAAARRIEVAKRNNWETRIARMSTLIEERLATNRAVERQWEEPLRRLYLLARHRILGTAVGILASYLLLFQSPLIWFMAEPLRMAQPARPADAIVVLAAGAGESGQAGGGYQERVKQAVDLYREGKAPRMILVSGYTFVFQEAEVMRDLAVSHGVPPAAILLETGARNTVEDVRAVRETLHKYGWRNILLVSSPYHMRRAVGTWRKLAPDVQVTPVPVARSQFYSHVSGRGASLEQIRGIMHEYAGIVYYWWKGWL